MLLPLTPVRLKRHAAKLFGRKIGVVCGEDRFTYGEFNERADRLSAALLRLGVRAGDRVAYLSFNCHRLLEAYYGVPQIGAILLPMNIRLTPEELTYILNDAAPRVLCFDPEFTPLVEALRPRAQSVEHYISLRDVKPAWAREEVYDELLAACAPAAIDFRAIDENSVAELFYTSGTTAYPKGVMLTHRNLYLHAFYTALGMGASDHDVHLYTVPLFHVNSWGAPHIFTLLGGRHVMLRKFDPPTVLELVQRERVTRLHMVPAMAIALLNHPNFSSYDLSSVHEVMIGGAPANAALMQEVESKIPGCIAKGGYGLTETSPVITIAHIKEHLADDSAEEKLHRQATAGYTLAGSETRVVDLDGRDVAADGKQVGEVLVRGDVVMEGYWRQPEATAAAIRDGWLHTGDLATLDAEGYILIVDRAKDMILSGGENVASAEIERVLYLHPAVLECAVVAIPDEQWGEVARAIITLRANREASEGEIIDHCRKHLAGFKIPKSVEFVDALPKGGTGKILKKVLRQKYWAGRERHVH
ncbi:MAG: fatty acid--CoA ligase [Terriglobia bacterium]|jgi:fatty-acyl-CoA synthase